MTTGLRFFKECWYRCVLGLLRCIGFGGRVPSEGFLLFKPDRIGDFVLATGLLHLLARELGPQNVTLMVSSIVQPLAAKEFPSLCIIAIPPVADTLNGGIWSGWWKTRRLNAGRSYRQLISLRHHPTLFEDLLLSCIPADESVSVDRTKWGESFWVRKLRSFKAKQTLPYPETGDPKEDCRELEAHRQLAERVLGRPIASAEILPRLNHLFSTNGTYLLLLPYGSDPIRTYPEASLIQAVDEADLPVDVSFVICGESSQTDKLSSLAEQIQKKVSNTVTLTFPRNLEEFAEVVAGAKCVFAMESAGAHLATTLDKRGVFVLGGGHFGLFAPWFASPRRAWLSQKLDCFGCDWDCSQPYVKCIHDITTAAVASALRSAWSAN